MFQWLLHLQPRLLSHFSVFVLPYSSSVHEVLQEYWSGMPFPPPGDLPNTGIELILLCVLYWQVGSLPLSPQGSPYANTVVIKL